MVNYMLFALLVLVPVVSQAAVIQLSRTGQTACYDAAGTVADCATSKGQDGKLQKGFAWPSPRFTDKGNGTVTDNLTTLVWAQDASLMVTRDPAFDTNYDPAYEWELPNDGLVIWSRALDYIKKLNAESYLGHTDWRLPNITELESLVDLSLSFPALPADNPFLNVNPLWYWSSTSDVEILDPSLAWFVDMADGDAGSLFKDSNNGVWPVRGGQ